MKILEIETTKEEIQDLKGYFPASPGAELMGKMMLYLEERAERPLRDGRTPLEEVRYYQGYLAALTEFSDFTRKFLGINLELISSDEEKTEEQDEEDIVDVGF